MLSYANVKPATPTTVCRMKNGKQIHIYCLELIYFKQISTSAFHVSSITIKFVGLVRVKAESNTCAAQVDVHPF